MVLIVRGSRLERELRRKQNFTSEWEITEINLDFQNVLEKIRTLFTQKILLSFRMSEEKEGEF